MGYHLKETRLPYPDTRPHAETMLYRAPGPHECDGYRFDFIVVPDAQVEAKLADGWHRSYVDACDTAKGDAAKKLEENEAEQRRIAAELAAAGQDDAKAGANGLRAVHKGRGVWDVQDADGKVIESGLTKEQAQAKVA